MKVVNYVIHTQARQQVLEAGQQGDLRCLHVHLRSLEDQNDNHHDYHHRLGNCFTQPHNQQLV